MKMQKLSNLQKDPNFRDNNPTLKFKIRKINNKIKYISLRKFIGTKVKLKKNRRFKKMKMTSNYNQSSKKRIL